MADIFVSYTSSDSDWAQWLGLELQAQGHVPHVHEWETEKGGDIYSWMEQQHDAADHVLCVVSDAYLQAPYSTLERKAALWQAVTKRPGFALFVVVKPCRLPTLVDHIRRCELFGLSDGEAQSRFRAFMESRSAPATAFYPGHVYAVSNVPIRVPEHFMGREDALAAVEAALKRYEGRVAITALHGLRGVGKTALAAAYAERHRAAYRATWWIRAQTEATMRADLAGLGVRLGWVSKDEGEGPALARVEERLRHEGDGLLLIYDNAHDAATLRPFLPKGGGAQVLVTSNAHAWRGLAEPVELRLWPITIGADYLVARTGRHGERAAGEALSDALGGLPLAHEQAAAYCERLDMSFAEYHRRFEAAPAVVLDVERDSPAEYHDGLTVAKTFALAIEKAARLHPGAEPLIAHAAMLAPEPIPLFLFQEGRGQLDEPLASALEGDGLLEAVAALRGFALVDRETIPDERDPTVVTDCIRLHRLVRIAARAVDRARRESIFRSLLGMFDPSARIDGVGQSSTRLRRLLPHEIELLMTVDFDDRAAGELINTVGSAMCHHVLDYSFDLSQEREPSFSENALKDPDGIMKRYASLCRGRSDRSAYPIALLNHAQALRYRARFGEALTLLDRALIIMGPELDGLSVLSLFDKADCLKELGRAVEAATAAEEALAFYLTDYPISSHDPIGLAASMYEQVGRLQEAQTLRERYPLGKDLAAVVASRPPDRFGPPTPAEYETAARLAPYSHVPLPHPPSEPTQTRLRPR